MVDKARIYKDFEVKEELMKKHLNDQIAVKDAEIVQLREKLPEKAVPVEPSVAKQAPQNYYFESLMLQNDQIQIELRRINEIVNS